MSFGAKKEDRIYEEITDMDKLKNIMAEVSDFSSWCKTSHSLYLRNNSL